MRNYLLLICFFFSSYEVFAKNCQETRMGFDIGSGSTKMMVAKVDFCEKKLLEVLYSESRPVAYNEDLEKSANESLSPEMTGKGLGILQEMVLKGKVFKPKKSYGVATSVFRKAKNGTEVIKGFSKKLGVKLDVISQKDEALLGYLAAKSQIKGKESDVIVWDIGGGSMQIIDLDERGNPQIYFGELASVTFKNMFMEVIQMKNMEQGISPNPILDKREQGIALARTYARLHVPVAIKSKLKDHTVVGIGGVHSQSIKNQLQLKEMKYTLSELEQASKTQVLKSDKELVGDYKVTDVTNLLLVQGFMEGLGVNEVNVINASLLQGVLVR